jgi:hypothetical protein
METMRNPRRKHYRSLFLLRVESLHKACLFILSTIVITVSSACTEPKFLNSTETFGFVSPMRLTDSVRM